MILWLYIFIVFIYINKYINIEFINIYQYKDINIL